MQEPETLDHTDDNHIDSLVAHTSLFPFGLNNGFNPVPPVDFNGDVRPKDTNTIYRNNNNRQQRQRQNDVPLNNAAMLPSPLRPPNRRRNDVSPSLNSESPTLPLSQTSMGQQAASVPPQWRHEPSVHSYHPSLATSNATYSSSQPPSLPRSGNSSTRSSRGRNSSGGSRASSNQSNAPMLRSDAAAAAFGNLGSFQGDSAHPSSDFGMRSVREEEEFPSIPDVISVSKVLALCVHVTILSPVADPVPGKGGGQETWNLCSRLRRPSFLWLIFTGPGGPWPPQAPSPGSATAAPVCYYHCYYRPQHSCGKVMFSQVCVKNSVHGGGG